MRPRIWIAFLMTAAAALAQSWEVGAAAGFGFNRASTITGPAGNADAGLAAAPAFGFYLGQDVSAHWGGEIRYTFRPGDLRVRSEGTEVTFGGQSHLVHYDLLVHGTSPRSRVRPFLAAGAGARLTRGTGRESSYQHLMEHALLTRTRQVQPVASLGAGIKVKLGKKLLLRAEFRDYVSPFPTQVIAPAGGAKIDGWLHDIVPLVGVGWMF